MKHLLSFGRGRRTKSCGGVGFYVRKGIKATPVIKSLHELNIGVVVIYNHPSCSNQPFAQHYEKVLMDLLDFGFDETFIVGDFNINVAHGAPFTVIIK